MCFYLLALCWFGWTLQHSCDYRIWDPLDSEIAQILWRVPFTTILLGIPGQRPPVKRSSRWWALRAAGSSQTDLFRTSGPPPPQPLAWGHGEGGSEVPAALPTPSPSLSSWNEISIPPTISSLPRGSSVLHL